MIDPRPTSAKPVGSLISNEAAATGGVPAIIAVMAPKGLKKRSRRVSEYPPNFVSGAHPANENQPVKAACNYRHGTADVVEIRDVPRPEISDDKILMRNFHSSMTTADWRLRAFELPAGTRLFGRLVLGPFAPRSKVVGGDFAGQVASIGRNVMTVLADLLRLGRITPVIDSKFPFTDIADAVRKVESRHTTGSVFINPVRTRRDISTWLQQRIFLAGISDRRLS